MAELMIAIVILGLGLLTVATMFPIAWTKARDVAEFTSQAAITGSAQNSLSLLTQVSNAATSSSFKGDLTPAISNPDFWVHPLHMENILCTNPSGPGTARPQVVGDFEDFNNGWWRNSDFELNPAASFTPLPNVQVAIHERLYPPLPPLPIEGTATEPQEQARWNDLLSQRRYCWAAFHKLDYDPCPGAGAAPTTDSARSFTVYFATLRRGQPTHRYARQDRGSLAALLVPEFVTDTCPTALPSTSMAPAALPATEDVMFPVPWRVQVEIVEPPVPVPPAVSTGIPAQAITNSATYPTNSLVTDMIQRGSVLIDEFSGKVYEVTSREPDPTTPDRAILTLDQEIPFSEPDNPFYGLDLDVSGTIDPGEALRTVWVFPPPAERDPSGAVIGFTGPQPVVGVEVRRMTFWP